jgi:hypothetical protein
MVIIIIIIVITINNNNTIHSETIQHKLGMIIKRRMVKNMHGTVGCAPTSWPSST